MTTPGGPADYPGRFLFDGFSPQGGGEVGRAVSALLAEGLPTRRQLDEAVRAVGVDGDMSGMRGIFLDLVLRYVDGATADRRISDDEAGAVRHMLRLFRIEEGDFLRLRRDATANLVRREMGFARRDGLLTHEEAVQESALQRALGIGYDEMLELGGGSR